MVTMQGVSAASASYQREKYLHVRIARQFALRLARRVATSGGDRREWLYQCPQWVLEQLDLRERDAIVALSWGE